MRLVFALVPWSIGCVTGEGVFLDAVDCPTMTKATFNDLDELTFDVTPEFHGFEDYSVSVDVCPTQYACNCFFSDTIYSDSLPADVGQTVTLTVGDTAALKPGDPYQAEIEVYAKVPGQQGSGRHAVTCIETFWWSEGEPETLTGGPCGNRVSL